MHFLFQLLRLQASCCPLLARAALVLCLGLSGVFTPFAHADAVPSHWISYATLASQQLEDRLSNTEEAHVVQLQEWLRKSQDVTRSVVVAIWIKPNGRVSQLEFAPLTNAAVNQALHELLSSTEFSEPPPADMPQPLRLRLGLGLSD